MKVKIIGWSTRYDGKTYPQGSVLTIRDEFFVKGHMEVLEDEPKMDYTDLDKADIRALLDEKGIKYSKRATKEQLLELLGA